jgi:hypothetical protein
MRKWHSALIPQEHTLPWPLVGILYSSHYSRKTLMRHAAVTLDDVSNAIPGPVQLSA